MLDWLLAPLSGSTLHHIDPAVAWHARLMVLAWGVLMPVGALAARYYKVVPGQDWPRQLDHRGWWHLHRALQYGGMALAAVGIALIAGPWVDGAKASGSPGWHGGLGSVDRHSQLSWVGWHGQLGWLVLALGVTQVLGGVLRGTKGGPTSPELRGDHYDMTPRRQWFERLHKAIGWLALLLAIAAIALGLIAADAPRWMPLTLALWWTTLAAWAWRAQRAGRCIDTYQAIWGPEARHPGNRLTPIGLGVHRPDPHSSRSPRR